MKLIKILKATALIWSAILISSLIIIFITGLISNSSNYYINRLAKGISLTLAGVCVYLFWKRDLSYLDLCKTNLHTVRKYFTFFLEVVFIFTFFFLLASLFNVYELKVWGIEKFSSSKLALYLLIPGVLANIFAVLGEEILFRGYLLTYLDSFLFAPYAIFISAVIFSIGHIQYDNVLSFILAFAGGIVIGYSYLKFKTLLIPITIHFAFNLFNFSLASGPVNGESIPFLLKIDYKFISATLGAWIDLFTLLSFIFLFFYLHGKNELS